MAMLLFHFFVVVLLNILIFRFVQMRDYNALFDWLEKFKLTIYIDNFVKGGFDMTSVHAITGEVRKSRAYYCSSK